MACHEGMRLTTSLEPRPFASLKSCDSSPWTHKSANPPTYHAQGGNWERLAESSDASLARSLLAAFATIFKQVEDQAWPINRDRRSLVMHPRPWPKTLPRIFFMNAHL